MKAAAFWHSGSNVPISPSSWSVSTWSVCSVSAAGWCKRTGSSSRTGCCLLLPEKTQRGQSDACRIQWIQRGSIGFHSQGSLLWALASRGPHSEGSPTHIYCKKSTNNKISQMHLMNVAGITYILRFKHEIIAAKDICVTSRITARDCTCIYLFLALM